MLKFNKNNMKRSTRQSEIYTANPNGYGRPIGNKDYICYWCGFKNINSVSYIGVDAIVKVCDNCLQKTYTENYLLRSKI